MNNTSPSLKNELFASYREVFLLLQEVFRQHHILYYLIGAQARNLHLVAHHIRPARVTNDIDFAIMVQDTDQYHIIMQALTEKGFEPSAGEPYRLLWKPTDTIVDLLPYGQMAQHHTVRFQDRNIELSGWVSKNYRMHWRNIISMRISLFPFLYHHYMAFSC